jgi:TPR repeat protein
MNERQPPDICYSPRLLYFLLMTLCGNLLLGLFLLIGLSGSSPEVIPVDRDSWRDTLGTICRNYQGKALSCSRTADGIRANLETAVQLMETARREQFLDQVDELLKLRQELQGMQQELDCSIGMPNCTSDGKVERSAADLLDSCDSPGRITCQELVSEMDEQSIEALLTYRQYGLLSDRNKEIAQRLETLRRTIQAAATGDPPCRSTRDCLDEARLRHGLEGLPLLRFACHDFLESGEACEELGWALFTGAWGNDGVYGDIDEAMNSLKRACSLGSKSACARVAEIPRKYDLSEKRVEMGKKNRSFYELLKEIRAGSGQEVPAPPVQ